MKLNAISDNPGAAKPRMRVGRGIGSGKGKTSGSGQKGQKSRSGVSINGFEGGQMPLHRRLPKAGFKNPFRIEWTELSLKRLQQAVDSGRIQSGATLDAQALKEAGVIRRVGPGVRLIGGGELKAALTLTLSGATKSAAEAVKTAGGAIELVGPLRKSKPATAEG